MLGLKGGVYCNSKDRQTEVAYLAIFEHCCSFLYPGNWANALPNPTGEREYNLGDGGRELNPDHSLLVRQVWLSALVCQEQMQER